MNMAPVVPPQNSLKYDNCFYLWTLYFLFTQTSLQWVWDLLYMWLLLEEKEIITIVNSVNLNTFSRQIIIRPGLNFNNHLESRTCLKFQHSDILFSYYCHRLKFDKWNIPCFAGSQNNSAIAVNQLKYEIEVLSLSTMSTWDGGLKLSDTSKSNHVQSFIYSLHF